jgi:ankyrin repeat protein
VKSLFKYTKDNCTTDNVDRFTPLIVAAKYGHVEMVRVLLEGGANVEGVNAYGATPLHHAAHNGQLEVCRLLLDWGAKVNTLNRFARTPLHHAAWRGHLPVVKLLVKEGADVRLKDKFGKTASDWARSVGKKDVADWLDSVSRG